MIFLWSLHSRWTSFCNHAYSCYNGCKYFISSKIAPANIRSHKLALQYYVKLKSCSANPAHNDTFYPKYKELFQNNKKAIKSFGLWTETIIGEVNMDLTEIHKTIIPDIPSWIIRTLNINLTLCKFHKNKTHPLIFQEELEKVNERYPKHSHIHGRI